MWRRDRDTVEKVERILSATLEVFSEYGYFEIPVHLIAEKTGVSKGVDLLVF